MRTVGIIGGGSFGQFLAGKLSPHFEVKLSRRQGGTHSFEDAAACDIVIPAIPFQAYPEVLQRLSDLVPADSLIVDVCSVKLKPIELIRQYLPGRRILATHPLFGPESAAKSLAHHVVVICPEVGEPDVIASTTMFLESLELRVVQMSADEHDRLMADLQGLTFFVAQGLVEYGVGQHDIITPSYQKLLYLAELEQNHSPELFATIENANPHAAAARERILQNLQQIHEGLMNPESE